MADPEVQKILNDPAMRMILEQMQNDPNAIQVRSLVQTITEPIERQNPARYDPIESTMQGLVLEVM